MDNDRLTVKETCEILDCSRAFIQKLEAEGLLHGRRENGRVTYSRIEVEALKKKRDGAKAERRAGQVARGEEAVERECRIINTEYDRREREALAQRKIAEDKQTERTIAELRAKVAGLEANAADREREERSRRAQRSVEQSRYWESRLAARRREADMAELLANAWPVAVMGVATLVQSKDDGSNGAPPVERPAEDLPAVEDPIPPTTDAVGTPSSADDALKPKPTDPPTDPPGLHDEPLRDKLTK